MTSLEVIEDIQLLLLQLLVLSHSFLLLLLLLRNLGLQSLIEHCRVRETEGLPNQVARRGSEETPVHFLDRAWLLLLLLCMGGERLMLLGCYSGVWKVHH